MEVETQPVPQPTERIRHVFLPIGSQGRTEIETSPRPGNTTTTSGQEVAMDDDLESAPSPRKKRKGEKKKHQ